MPLSDQEVVGLIFMPGFSTAESVTDVSGRGVGMDMVRASAEAIGGKVSVSSKVDQGTTISLVIPKQNMSVSMEALLVQCGSRTIAIPQQKIARLCNLSNSSDVKWVQHEGTKTLHIEGKLIPMLALPQILEEKDIMAANDETLSLGVAEIVVINDEHGLAYALCVDAISDIEEVVIRSLPSFANPKNLYRGAALLNDGAVGLVLDTDGIADLAGIHSKEKSYSQTMTEHPKISLQNAFFCLKMSQALGWPSINLRCIVWSK
jgi:two-component system, chemotaxis family, sensor kinase CheA